MPCLGCGTEVVVPAEGTAPRPVAARPVRRPPAAKPDGWRRIARWSLIVTVIPLLVHALTSRDDLKERLKRTVERHPELDARLKNGEIRPTLDGILGALPGKKIDGAFFSRATRIHWIAAAFAACLFWEFILIVQPMGAATSRQLWAVGAFTGTVGILFLLIVQAAAIGGALMPVGTGIGAVVIAFLKFIGYSYLAAFDRDNGFWASLLGFTFGVGLCEELCKALPLLWRVRRGPELDVRGAVVWGLASGIGFGVSEAVSYCTSYYNGLATGSIYVARFISCVALHAVWSATVAILMWRHRERLESDLAWYERAFLVGAALAPSIVLHGLYDTLAKRDLDAGALLVAAGSFVLFFWLYEKGTRRERPAAAYA